MVLLVLSSPLNLINAPLWINNHDGVRSGGKPRNSHVNFCVKEWQVVRKKCKKVFGEEDFPKGIYRVSPHLSPQQWWWHLRHETRFLRHPPAPWYPQNIYAHGWEQCIRADGLGYGMGIPRRQWFGIWGEKGSCLARRGCINNSQWQVKYGPDAIIWMQKAGVEGNGVFRYLLYTLLPGKYPW